MYSGRSWNQHNGRSAKIHNWPEIILFILIGLMIFILAYQAIIHRGRSHAAKLTYERTQLMFNSH